MPRAPCVLPPACCRLHLAAPCAHAPLCAYALGAWHAVATLVVCTVSCVMLRHCLMLPHRLSSHHRPRPTAQLVLTPRCGRGESRVAGQPLGAGAVRGLLQGRPKARLRPRGCAAQARQIRQRLPRRCASSLPRALRHLLAPRSCFHVVKQAFLSRVQRARSARASSRARTAELALSRPQSQAADCGMRYACSRAQGRRQGQPCLQQAHAQPANPPPPCTGTGGASPSPDPPTTVSALSKMPQLNNPP